MSSDVLFGPPLPPRPPLLLRRAKRTQEETQKKPHRHPPTVQQDGPHMTGGREGRKEGHRHRAEDEDSTLQGKGQEEAGRKGQWLWAERNGGKKTGRRGGKEGALSPAHCSAASAVCRVLPPSHPAFILPRSSFPLRSSFPHPYLTVAMDITAHLCLLLICCEPPDRSSLLSPHHTYRYTSAISVRAYSSYLHCISAVQCIRSSEECRQASGAVESLPPLCAVSQVLFALCFVRSSGWAAELRLCVGLLPILSPPLIFTGAPVVRVAPRILFDLPSGHPAPGHLENDRKPSTRHHTARAERASATASAQRRERASMGAALRAEVAV